MLVPKLRFKREDGTDYPEWKDCILSDYCEEIKASIDPKKYPNDSFLEYSMPAFDMGKIPNNVIGRDMNSNRKVVNYPCVLINKLNVRKKRIWKVLKPMSNSVCSAEFIPVKSDKMSIDFLECLALSDRFTARLLDCSTGTSNSQKRVTPNIIMDMSVSICCLEEQQKIADFLSTVDEVITQSEAEVQNLEQQKKSAMQKIFSQELRFKREDGSDYPEWEEILLGKIGEVAMCKRILKEQTSDKGDVPFFKISTFGRTPDAYITYQLFEEFKKTYRFPQKGAVLISAAGTVGKIVRYNGEDAYYQDSNIVWLEHNDKVTDDFLYQFYQQVSWKGLEGSTIKRLYNKNLLETSISLPCFEEQQKIADFLSALDETISYARQELDKWKELKKGLLQQMFV